MLCLWFSYLKKKKNAYRVPTMGQVLWLSLTLIPSFSSLQAVPVSWLHHLYLQNAWIPHSAPCLQLSPWSDFCQSISLIMPQPFFNLAFEPPDKCCVYLMILYLQSPLAVCSYLPCPHGKLLFVSPYPTQLCLPCATSAFRIACMLHNTPIKRWCKYLPG